MGEFTSGVLYHKKYEPCVTRYLPRFRQPYFHKTVNKLWNAFFLQDEQLQRADTLQNIRMLSQNHLPLLWFHDNEESGWGFRLFIGGQEVSSAAIHYDLDVQLAKQEMARRIPGMDLDDAITQQSSLYQQYEQLLDEMIETEKFRQEVAKGISRFRPEAFRMIVNGKQLQQLAALFDAKLLTEVDMETGNQLLYDSVDLFKEIIGIEEMIWVNYSYLASSRKNE